MASCSFSSAKYISRYIRDFETSSTLACTRCVRSGSSCICLSEVLKRCAACAGMSQKYEFPFWSVLER